jgi:hypothetical protein
MSVQSFNPSANGSTQYKVKAAKLVTMITLCAPLWVQIQQGKEIFLLKNDQTSSGPTQPPIQRIPRFSPLMTENQVVMATLVQEAHG